MTEISPAVARRVADLNQAVRGTMHSAKARLISDMDSRLKTKAEQHLHDFVKQAWPLVEPGVPFLDNWHIVLICEYLMAVSLGIIKRLWINIPPRYSKSTLVSVMWPCWEWAAIKPSQSWVVSTYVQSLSTTLSRKRRDIVSNPWYQSRWPMPLRPDLNTQDEFGTTLGGVMIATSVGGRATGLGGDRLLIDDPTDPGQAISDTERERSNEWYFSTFASRLNDKRMGAIVGIQQRLHQHDMTGALTGLDITDMNGHVLEGNGWTLLRIPLVAEQDEDLYSPLPGHRLIHSRKEGDLLWPEREGPEQIAEYKNREYVYAAQFQQRPSPKAGAMFQRDWFKFYDKLPVDPDTWVMSLDGTFGKGDTRDYVTVGVWAWKKPNMYLDYELHAKLSFTETLGEVKRILLAYPNISAKLFEKAASGEPLQDMLHTEIGGIILIPPNRSKETRAAAVTPYFQTGNVWIKNAPWTNEFISEMVNFPGSRYDDQVDAASQAIEYMQRTFGGLHSCDEEQIGIARFISSGRSRRRF